jgi:PKD repeat protein
MDVPVDSSGSWQADFGAQGFDITHQHGAAVFLQEFDGGVSAVGKPQNPFNIDAFPDGPGIHILGDLTPDSTVILAVYEFEGGPLIFEDTLTVSSAGDAWWNGWEGDIYLYPGTYIKATDENSGWVETMTVIDVTYEAVDLEANTAQGHALPGTEFGVDFYFRETATTPYVAEKLIVTAGEDGYWLADFGAAGIDIPPYAFHGVHINDGDGDMTIDNLPYIFASEDNWIWIRSFTPDTPVTVEIYDEPDGALIYGPYTLQTDPAGRVFFWASAYGADLQPGYYSIVTDETTGFAKTHELESVNLQVDADSDLVFGNSKPGAWIRANPQGARAVFTVANEYGEWLVDFGAIGVDLTDDGYVNVNVYDEDNDYTWESWPPPNQPPNINTIDGPAEPVAVNTEVQVSADFTDPDDGDAHTALWDWGDGTSTAGTVDQANNTVSGSHTYLEAGIYSLTLTVTDDDGNFDTAIYEYIVVYDPEGGFVTGGGWIYSAVGWCQLDDFCAGAEGRANFGFVSKYKKGASAPTGNTEFNFKAGGLNFHSSSYDWLVVNQNGTNAQYKGSGTINGEGDYKFMLWAGDHEADTLRIKIWYEDEDGAETVVYDNGFDQLIGGGNIVVHTGKK